MKKLKKVLALALSLLMVGGGLAGREARKVDADVPQTLVYEFKYTDIPSGYASSGTSGTFVVSAKDNSEAQKLTIGYEGLNTKSSATGGAYSYTMFIKNAGFLYSNNSITGYYPSNVKVTTSSGTGTSGKIGCTYTDAKNGTRNSSVSGSVAKDSSYNYSNTNQKRLFWNFSTTSANVQIVSCTITYSLVKTSTPCNIPVVSISGTTVSFAKDSNSSEGYELLLFTYVDSTYIQYGNAISIPQDTTNSTINYTIEKLPQGISFYAKIKALGNGDDYSESELSDIISFNDEPVAIINNVYEEIKPSVARNTVLKETSEPFYYYDIKGVVRSVYNEESNPVKTIYLCDSDDTETYVGIDNILNFSDYTDICAGDSMTIRAYKKTDVKWTNGTIINHSYQPVDRIGYSLSKLKTYSSLKVGYSVHEEPSTESKWTLVTSTADLVAGNFYTFANTSSGNGKAMANTTSGNSRAVTTVSVTNSSFAENSNILKLKLGGASGAWEFVTTNYGEGEQYLNTTNTTSSNYLKVVETNDEYGLFTVSFGTGNNAVVTCTGKSTRNVMQYNSSNSIFSCYTSGQSSIYLYKLSAGQPTYSYSINQVDSNKNDVSLRFGVAIPASLKQEIDAFDDNSTKEYGIMIKKGNGEAQYIPVNTGVFTTSAMSNLALEEELSTAVDKNHFYQYVLSLDHIPTEAFSTNVTACGYVRIKDIAYSTGQASYSVNSIAAEYVKNHAEENGVKNHVGMLTWLSTYNG